MSRHGARATIIRALADSDREAALLIGPNAEQADAVNQLATDQDPFSPVMSGAFAAAYAENAPRYDQDGGTRATRRVAYEHDYNEAGDSGYVTRTLPLATPTGFVTWGDVAAALQNLWYGREV